MVFERLSVFKVFEFLLADHVKAVAVFTDFFDVVRRNQYGRTVLRCTTQALPDIKAKLWVYASGGLIKNIKIGLYRQ